MDTGIPFAVSAGVPGFLGYENRLEKALGFDWRSFVPLVCPACVGSSSA